MEELQLVEQRASLQAGMKHDFLPLKLKFSAINAEHFKNIAENKFLPENISKLSNDPAAVKPERKYIRKGEIDLHIREDDALTLNFLQHPIYSHCEKLSPHIKSFDFSFFYFRHINILIYRHHHRHDKNTGAFCKPSHQIAFI